MHLLVPGTPVHPGSDGISPQKKDALKIANKIGFPIIIKASSGGGGKGMRIVEDKNQLENAILTAQHESHSAFGSSDFYIEKYIPKMKHIEVQIIVDSNGNAIHLGERDCSVQRRHQKLIEEAPAPISTEKLRKKLGE